MKTKSLHIIFATLLISLISISCGRKVTNIYNPTGSPSDGPSTPSHNSSGGNTGGSTTNPNPGPITGGCGSDGCGGDVISNNHVMIYNMFSSEKKLIEWITLQTISFLKMYGLVIDEDPLIDRFFTALESDFETKHIRKKINDNIEIRKDILDSFYALYSIDEQNRITRKTEAIKGISMLTNYNEHINRIIKKLFAFQDTSEEVNQTRVANIIKPLEKIRFDLRKDSSCEHTLEGQTKLATGSATSNGAVHTICISLSDLATKTTSSDLNFIYSFFIHEISHIYGFDELDATRLQNIMNEALQKNSTYDAKNEISYNFVNKTETLISELIDTRAYIESLDTSRLDRQNELLHKLAVQIQIWGESHLINSIVNNNNQANHIPEVTTKFESRANLDVLSFVPIEGSYQQAMNFIMSKNILQRPDSTFPNFNRVKSSDYPLIHQLLKDFTIDLIVYKLAEIIRLPSQTGLYDLRPIVGETLDPDHEDLFDSSYQLDQGLSSMRDKALSVPVFNYSPSTDQPALGSSQNKVPSVPTGSATPPTALSQQLPQSQSP